MTGNEESETDREQDWDSEAVRSLIILDRYRDARSMRSVLESFALKGLQRHAPTRLRRNWKSWLGEYWAEVVVLLLLGALVARVSVVIGSLSP